MRPTRSVTLQKILLRAILCAIVLGGLAGYGRAWFMPIGGTPILLTTEDGSETATPAGLTFRGLPQSFAFSLGEGHCELAFLPDDIGADSPWHAGAYIRFFLQGPDDAAPAGPVAYAVSGGEWQTLFFEGTPEFCARPFYVLPVVLCPGDTLVVDALGFFEALPADPDMLLSRWGVDMAEMEISPLPASEPDAPEPTGEPEEPADEDGDPDHANGDDNVIDDGEPETGETAPEDIAAESEEEAPGESPVTSPPD